jgi:hypothetical protein
VWDNYPVNDGSMSESLHVGPYVGRDPELGTAVAGVLCNPMTQPVASRVALATAAAFFADPSGYEPEAAWAEALTEVVAADGGHVDAAAFVALATACRDSPLVDPSELAIATAVRDLTNAAGEPARVEALRALTETLRALRDAAKDIQASGGPLAAETAPWAAAAVSEATAGLAALRLLQQIRPLAADRYTVVPPDAEHALEHAFGTMFAWRAARANDRIVCGPRFRIHPAVVQRDDGSPGIDTAAAVREDANAIDALCRYALGAYDAWRTNAGAGTPAPMQPPLPFRDRRLS